MHCHNQMYKIEYSMITMEVQYIVLMKVWYNFDVSTVQFQWKYSLILRKCSIILMEVWFESLKNESFFANDSCGCKEF